jgi:hypothetical protein
VRRTAAGGGASDPGCAEDGGRGGACADRATVRWEEREGEVASGGLGERELTLDLEEVDSMAGERLPLGFSSGLA